MNTRKNFSAVKKLHSRGLTDREIAAKIGLRKASAAGIRRVLGLSANIGTNSGQFRSVQIPASTKKRITEMHRNGMSNNKISIATGIRRHALRMLMNELGLIANGRSAKFSIAKLRALHRKLKTDSEIAEELGIPSYVVWRARKRLGLKSYTELRSISWRDMAAKLYDAGMSDNEICAKIGISGVHLWKWRKSRGLSPNVRPNRKGMVLYMLSNGGTVEDIAKKLGMDRRSVVQARRRILSELAEAHP